MTIKLRPRPKLKKLRIDIDFADLMIKGRTAKEIWLPKIIFPK